MIDTHCHLDSPRFDPDRASVLERAFSAGVRGILIPAIGPEGWEALLNFPSQDARLQVGLGLHPQLLPELPAEEDAGHLARLEALLSRTLTPPGLEPPSPAPTGRPVAIGECGLDGPSAERAPLRRQLEVLEAHFTLARRYRLPLLVHCLRAHHALVDFLKGQRLPEAGAVLHSYSGGAELVSFYLKAGFHFSLAGPLTFPNARKPHESLRAIPLERLHAETDAPDQAPVPHRGERCEPAHLARVVEAMALSLNLPEEALRAQLLANAQRLFPGAFPAPPEGPRPQALPPRVL